jgi:hypothetical protein
LVVAAVAAALAPAPLAAETPKASPVAVLAKPVSKLAPVAAPVFKIEALTKAAFDKLPDNALLDIQGRHRPKSEFLAERKRALDEAAARLQAAGGGAELAGFQDEVRRLDGAEVERETAKVRAEAAKLRVDSGKGGAPGDLDAFRRAAIDLRNRYRSASLTERIEIEKQAADLLRKAREMKK